MIRSALVATLCFYACVTYSQSMPKNSMRHKNNADLARVLNSEKLAPYAPVAAKPCPDQWKSLENDIRIERQFGVDSGASYYIPPESKEVLVNIVLGNPYAEPLRADHPVPSVDDELSVWLSHNSEPKSAPRQFWVLGYSNPLNRSGQQFTQAVAVLGSEYGLFTFEVRYRDFGGDSNVYVKIGGAGMCSGNAWCEDEIRSWDRTNRTLKAAKVWRSLLKVPQCPTLVEDSKTKRMEWSFEAPATSKTNNVK